jgi:hypothetical protein
MKKTFVPQNHAVPDPFLVHFTATELPAIFGPDQSILRM